MGLSDKHVLDYQILQVAYLATQLANIEPMLVKNHILMGLYSTYEHFRKW